MPNQPAMFQVALRGRAKVVIVKGFEDFECISCKWRKNGTTWYWKLVPEKVETSLEGPNNNRKSDYPTMYEITRLSWKLGYVLPKALGIPQRIICNELFMPLGRSNNIYSLKCTVFYHFSSKTTLQSPPTFAFLYVFRKCSFASCLLCKS